jgi:CTP:molybdopterin cytidylyltransferase MocA
MNSPAAIVLAAGEGRRMGGPKALLVVNGKPLVWQHVVRLREAGCRPIAVMVRPQIATEVQAICGEMKCVSVVQAETTSPAASLTVGLRLLAPVGEGAIFVTPVDLLPPQFSTLNALLAALAEEGVSVVTPQYRGRGGHPVAIRARLLRTFLEARPGTLRDLIASAEGNRRRVEVDDPAIAGDLNTPGDLHRMARAPQLAHLEHTLGTVDLRDGGRIV